jgi:hypothetical protein
MEKIEQLVTSIINMIKDKFKTISTETLGWLANIVLHCATVPTWIAVMKGLTDKMPGVDIILMVWTALVLLFIKAILNKDMLNIITIGLGFALQATLMALIFIK